MLVWNATVAYKDGSDWIRIDTLSGIGQATTRIDFLPASLSPGTYQATIAVDAGAAGRVNLPVKLTVTPALPPAPTITSVINAATLQPGALVRGPFGTIMGANLMAADTAVTLDDAPAKIVIRRCQPDQFPGPSHVPARPRHDL